MGKGQTKPPGAAQGVVEGGQGSHQAARVGRPLVSAGPTLPTSCFPGRLAGFPGRLAGFQSRRLICGVCLRSTGVGRREGPDKYTKKL